MNSLSYRVDRVGMAHPRVRSPGSFNLNAPSFMASLQKSLYHSTGMAAGARSTFQPQKGGWRDEAHSTSIYGHFLEYVCVCHFCLHFIGQSLVTKTNVDAREDENLVLISGGHVPS